MAELSEDRSGDRQEIYEVLIRYCRGIDRLDEALVRSCYHEDAIDNHGLYNGTVDHFIASAFTRQSSILTACHYLHNFSVAWHGDAAVSETYATAVERNQTSSGLADDLVGLRYIDRFEKRSGGPWLIARRTVVVDWTRHVVVDEGWLAERGLTRGRRDRADLIYSELELLYGGAP